LIKERAGECAAYGVGVAAVVIVAALGGAWLLSLGEMAALALAVPAVLLALPAFLLLYLGGLAGAGLVRAAVEANRDRVGVHAGHGRRQQSAPARARQPASATGSLA
jgi:hypothetical protein